MNVRRPRPAFAARSTVVLGALLLMLGVLAPGATASPIAAAEPVASVLAGETVESPDGSLAATVGVVDGRLTYGVLRDEATTIVAPSGLGFTLTEPTVDLTSGMSITGVERSSQDETWTPAWGTDSRIRNHYNELLVHALHEESGTKLDVTIRIFDDGFGLRYTFPQQEVLGAFNVAKELTRFGLPGNATAYYIKSGTDWNADEKHYITAPVTTVATAQTPMTLSVGDNLFMSVHEANLTDYPSMTLNKDAGVDGRLVSELMPLPGGLKAKLDVTAKSFSTPWRTITVGRDAGDLGDSHLINNLNPPCAICDVDSDADGEDDTTDWIKPATYTGVWWELQRRATTWFAGPNHGATTQRVKDYIDLADEAGAKFVLAEGWNTNAGNNWTGQDFLTPQADFDLPQVLAYAKSKGIGYVAHNETRGEVDYYEQNLEKIFSKYEELGIHAIKTGYATKFRLGGVLRGHADQEAVRHYRRVIEVAAKHKITVNAHEAIKPTGLDRTYPNMMSGEGVAGMEQQNYMGANGNPPEQATILPFTRWIGGPADYTPGVLNVLWDPANLKTRVQTTTATQLALYTTFFSPLQMLADTPENYAGQPVAFEYLKDMPATWDESDVLDAKIGDYIVTARRSGQKWYLGAVTDENDRTVNVPLDFLDDGTKYVADVFADAADASWKGNPMAVKRTRTIVDSTDTLAASMVGAGGQAVRFTKASAADLEAFPEHAEAGLSVAGEPTAAYDPLSRTVTVTADVTNNGSVVAWAYLYLNGERLSGVRARLEGRSSTPVTFKVPADSIPYARNHQLAIGDGASSPGTPVDVSLLPFPTQGMADRLGELVDAGDLDPEVGRRVERLLQGAITLAGDGDLAGTELKMQSIRLQLRSARVDQVKASALAELDKDLARWLGAPSGVMSVLTDIRAAEDASGISTVDARAWRDDAAAAARAAIRRDATALRTALDHLAAALAEASDTGPVVALRALVAQQRSAPTLLEAEAGTLTGGTASNTEHAGYTGTGFVKGFTVVDACTEITPNAVAPGGYLVTVRFANGMTVLPLDRQLTLAVGSRDAKIAFPNQGQDANRWKRWVSSAPTRYGLKSGDKIKLCYADGDTGNINADSITLTPDTGVIVRKTPVDLPTVTATVDPADPDGDNGWWTEGVDVTAVAGGAEGAEPEIRVDEGDWTPVAGALHIDQDGQHTVQARATTDDETSAPQRLDVKIDATAPVSVAKVDLAGRSVSVRAADETSGVAAVQVRTSPGADFTTYDGPVAVGQDKTILTFRAVDRAGNLEDAYEVTVPGAGVELAETTIGAVGPSGLVPFGSDVRIGAKVTARSGQPVGWVEVWENDKLLARGELGDGRTTIDVPDLAIGSHELTIRYAGDQANASSTDEVTVTVGRAVSATTLDVGPLVVAGSAPTAKVAVDAGGANAEGIVRIRSGSTVVAEGSLSSGRATLTLSRSLVRKSGHLKLTATYAGSETVSASSSRVVRLTVVKARPSGVTVSGSRLRKGTRPKIVVKVGALNNGLRPHGLVTIYVNNTKVRTVGLPSSANGKVVVRLSRKYAAKSSIRVKAKFTPADRQQAASRTSVTVKVKKR